MIFVTVGTYKGKALVQKMDTIAKSLDDEVVIQIGYSEYLPRNCRYFDFAPSLETYYQQASLIIGHGGLGTIFEILSRQKHFIGVSNELIPDTHQNELLEKLSLENYVLWCPDIDELHHYIEKSKTFTFRSYSPPSCRMDEVIYNFLQ